MSPSIAANCSSRFDVDHAPAGPSHSQNLGRPIAVNSCSPGRNSATRNRSGDLLRVTTVRFPAALEKRALTRSDDSRSLRAMRRHEAKQSSGRCIDDLLLSLGDTTRQRCFACLDCLQEKLSARELANSWFIVESTDDLATDDPETVQVTTNGIR